MLLLFLTPVLAETEPEPWGAIPTQEQIQYHRDEIAVLISFGVNTFTDSEWGTGKEDPNVFQPTNLDCDRWVKSLKEDGFKRVIMVAKHRDGFCLWKSNFTNHTVANSRVFQEQSVKLKQSGDVLLELSKACTKYDMGMGLYLSSWDANSEYYGNTELYNKYYMDQLEEILGNSSYGNNGSFVEVWIDGAKDPNAKDQKYLFDDWFKLITKLQPEAVILSPYGSTVRWIGNHEGKAAYPSYSKLNRERQRNWYDTYGSDEVSYLQTGDMNGDIWSVAACDISLTTGWFWHPDQIPKSSVDLVEAYMDSVGRGHTFLVNIGPDQKGQLPQEYSQVRVFSMSLKHAFEENLALGPGVTATASGERGPSYSAMNVLDNNTETFWAMEDGSLNGWLVVDLGESKVFNVIVISEHIALGQRVNAFTVELHCGGSGWLFFAKERTIGAKHIIRLDHPVADMIRLNFTNCSAVPLIESVGVFDVYSWGFDPDKMPGGLKKVASGDFNRQGQWKLSGNGALESSTNGSSISSPIAGTKFWLRGNLDEDYGNVTVSIDGEVVDTISLEASRSYYRQIIFESDELSPGVIHEMNVTALSNDTVGVGPLYVLDNNGAGMFELASVAYDVGKGLSLTIVVKRVFGANGTATVMFETASSSAIKDRHYEEVSVILEFADGETSKKVTVHTIYHNETVKKNLTFYALISQPTGGAIIGFNSSARITLLPITPSPTRSPRPTPYPTRTVSASATRSRTPTRSPWPTERPTRSPWPTESPTRSPWPTESPTPDPTSSPAPTEFRSDAIIVLWVFVAIIVIVGLGTGVVIMVYGHRKRKLKLSDSSTHMPLVS